MKFIVQDEVFKKLEGVCFGIVIARGIDNKKQIDAVNKLLLNNIYEAVIAARDELAQILKKLFDCEISTGLVNKDNMVYEII